MMRAGVQTRVFGVLRVSRWWQTMFMHEPRRIISYSRGDLRAYIYRGGGRAARGGYVVHFVFVATSSLATEARPSFTTYQSWRDAFTAARAFVC